MIREDFSLQTMDGTDIFCCKWSNPSIQEIHGIVQISHGMAEHVLRYEDFARYLVDRGFIVFGHDHRGHGKTAKKKEEIGYFTDDDGFEQVVRDVKQLTDLIQNDYPSTPIVLFGHSMGSFIARRYVQLFGHQLVGAIFSGTGGDPGFLGKMGLFIAEREGRKKGRRTASPLLDKLSFGHFNKQFKPNRTDFDWLTRDEEQVDLYIADPACGNIFTAGFFADLFTGLLTIHRQEEINKIPKQLPLLLIAGDQDPVGKSGKGVRQVYQQYKKAGMEDVSLKLYEGARHEILNETNREEVFHDIASWITRVCSRL
ncbi:alpha-beta hydrolase superfamily lysophospholipase [Oikeobacillus pervagus]|uniref:Alpha-beta hydrolase superfamily lysophospholipase n=1 Tax=Oikeobacillus pervagus TaxID=1325931 RepID=A0AAJ1SX94_9BACI|nr:alpha/beta hydrolase [Oikeobacillus pervagus]MDQ0214465.1 alpha-beta hydrolase superfamily lysophospholipase [Oikeobacillus pervagus]